MQHIVNNQRIAKENHHYRYKHDKSDVEDRNDEIVTRILSLDVAVGELFVDVEQERHPEVREETDEHEHANERPSERLGGEFGLEKGPVDG